MKKFNLHAIALLILLVSCKKNDSSPIVVPPDEIAIAAEQNLCLSGEILQNEMATNPKRSAFLEDLELKTKNYKGRENENFRIAGKLYLPVVIHIVLTDPNLVTDAQVKSQIDVLNKDFNKVNTELSNPSVYLAGYQYSKIANCNIQFYVTQIVRKTTALTGFEFRSEDMKFETTGGSNAIDPANKLNIWVCNVNQNVGSWAKYPGGAPEIDGIVSDYEVFGTTFPSLNYSGWAGRMNTHNVGHWLNLYDVSPGACGDDYISDTPLHDHNRTYYDNSPPQGLRSTCKSKPLMQWMNFMNPATKGSWIYMFTDGQKRRMDATIDFARKSYFSTIKLFPEVVL